VIAFEMACQLRADGEPVARLVLIDSTAPGGWPGLGHRAQSRAQELRATAPDAPRDGIGVVVGRAARFGVSFASSRAKRAVALATAGWLPRRGYHQYEVFSDLTTRMVRKYTPSSVFDGPTLLVRGDATDVVLPGAVPAQPRAQWARADLGWSEFVRGPISVVDVRSDHSGLLRRPAVDVVAQHIVSALDAVAPASPT
jgi:phthiocerol/phenolphthiocerol synthesis type-I polyketide synthase D